MMKRIYTVIGLVGILVLVFTVRTFAAAPTQSLQQANSVSQLLTTTPTAIQPAQITPTNVAPQTQSQFATATPASPGMGMTGRMMGGKGGRMMQGRMGMHGGMHSGTGMMQMQMSINLGENEFSMTHEKRISGLTLMHDDVAMRLGMSTEDMYHQMANGKSLVQLAAEKGISEQQLMDGILAGRRAAYDQAVKEGHMTQAQADAMLQNLNDNLKMMVNNQGSGSAGWSMMWDTQPNP